jgi:hypothetical protein
VTSPVAETRLTQELVSCPVLVEQPSTQIVLDTAWLDKAPTLGNRTTHAAMLEICDGLLLELGRRSGVAGGSERFCSRTLPTDRTSKLSRSACQNKAASAAAEPVERRGGAK